MRRHHRWLSQPLGGVHASRRAAGSLPHEHQPICCISRILRRRSSLDHVCPAPRLCAPHRSRHNRCCRLRPSAICLVVDVIVIFTRETSNVAEPPPQPAINFEDLPGNKRSGSILLILVIILGTYFGETNRKLGGSCRSDANCMSGLSCCNWDGCVRRKCVQTTVASPFDTIDTSLPFNKYAFLTTH